MPQDTDNTLRYANRAKNIKVTAASRVTTVTLHVSEYRRVIAALQKEVAELRSQLEHTSPRGCRRIHMWCCVPTVLFALTSAMATVSARSGENNA